MDVTVVTDTLSDGSIAYSILVGDGFSIFRFDVVGREEAEQLANLLKFNVSNIEAV